MEYYYNPNSPGYNAAADPTVGSFKQNVRNMASNLGNKATAASQRAGALFPRGQLMGGALALPTIGLVATDLTQGRTLDAAGTAVGGAATLAATEAIGRRVGGKYGAAIRGIGALAAPAVGNLLGNTLEGK
ncbi:hypothetical protein, partial [Neptuniibacter sp.]|uniref:hypothetical protein n=1 Tax=Neptuniibacter sp. TaxID=1962643 RepID=UPI0026361EC7